MKYLLLNLIVLMFSFFKKQSDIQPTSIYDTSIEMKDLYGDAIDWSKYKGKKLLIVNVASECGFTGQYEGLQALYDQYGDKLEIIGVPCNQFGGQEPGSNKEIASFCKANYGVTFRIAEKVDVKGDQQHALYQWLTSEDKNGKVGSSVKWNFQKYLLDEDGQLIDYFYSMTKPQSDKITKHIK